MADSRSVITVVWDGDEIDYVLLDPAWRRAGASEFAAEVLRQFNDHFRVGLTPTPTFGRAESLSFGELRVLRELLDAYNEETSKLKAISEPGRSPGEIFREPPLAAYFANNKIFKLEIPEKWLERTPAETVASRIESLLQRLPVQRGSSVPDSYLRAVDNLERFWR